MYEEKKQICENCKFYKPNASRSGKCVRYPPQVCNDNYDYIFSHPLVYSEDWCGEFKNREPSIDPYEQS